MIGWGRLISQDAKRKAYRLGAIIVLVLVRCLCFPAEASALEAGTRQPGTRRDLHHDRYRNVSRGDTRCWTKRTSHSRRRLEASRARFAIASAPFACDLVRNFSIIE